MGWEDVKWDEMGWAAAGVKERSNGALLCTRGERGEGDAKNGWGDEKWA